MELKGRVTLPANRQVNNASRLRPLRMLMLRVGGWENWVDTVAAFLSRNGVEVTGLVFVHGASDALTHSPEVTLVREECGQTAFGKLGATLHAGRLLRRHLARGDYDCVYVMDSWSIPTLWVASGSRLRWKDAALVYHTFEWLDPTVHSSIRIRLERKICRKADLVVNADKVRGRVQQMLYRLRVAPLWLRVGLSRGYTLPKCLPERRAAMLGKNPPADALVVLCPSIASAERLALELLQAIALLPNRFRVAMIEGTGDYYQACLKRVAELGISDRVTFMPKMSFHRAMEYVVAAEIGAILHDGSNSLGNFLANPSRLSMFASCGIPFVASDLPTVAVEVARHALGLCCDERDPESISQTVLDIAQGGFLSPKHKTRIQQAFQEHLCFEAQAPKLLSALRNLLPTLAMASQSE